MTFKRSAVCIALFAALALAIPSFAFAGKKVGTYYHYGTCASKKSCEVSAYTVNSKHRFSATIIAASYDKGVINYTAGKMKISGKVSKQNKVTGTYTIDKIAADCSAIKDASFSAKYIGKVSGFGKAVSK